VIVDAPACRGAMQRALAEVHIDECQATPSRTI
jgi:hypothetical protein